MLLCLSASRIYNTLSILIRSRKIKKAIVLYPFWFTQVEVLAWYYYAWALLGYITRLAFRPVAVKKNLGSCSISFLVHPGRSPGMMLLCLSASRIYNTFSISILSRKKKLRCCSTSFLVHPGRSRCMMLLCLSASRIYNTLNISIRSRKKKKKIRLLFFIKNWIIG